MADITMCTQTLCPNAGHCSRSQAKESEWQSWEAFEYTIALDGVQCEHYIPMKRAIDAESVQTKQRSTKWNLEQKKSLI